MDPALWAVVGAIAALTMAAIAVVTFWMTMGAHGATVLSETTAAKALAVAAQVKADVLAREFSDHRERTAAGLASVEATARAATAAFMAAEGRLAAAMSDLGGRFEQMSARLDRMLERDNAAERGRSQRRGND